MKKVEVKWVESSLTSEVTVCQAEEEEYRRRSGVLQGTVPAPFLFTQYTVDFQDQSNPGVSINITQMKV